MSSHEALEQVVRHLEPSKCVHLYKRARDTFRAVRATMINALTQKVVADLEALEFPQCVLTENVTIAKLKSGYLTEEVSSLRKHFFTLATIERGPQKHPPCCYCSDAIIVYVGLCRRRYY